MRFNALAYDKKKKLAVTAPTRILPTGTKFDSKP